MTNYAMKTLFFLLGLLLAVSVVPAYAVLCPDTIYPTDSSYVPWAAGVTRPYTGEMYNRSGHSFAIGSKIDSTNCGIGNDANDYFVNDYIYVVVGDPSGCGANADYSRYNVTKITNLDNCPNYITYVAPLVEPATCSDLIVSGDEAGIDCGGSCLSACKTVCPPSDTIVQDVINFSDYCASTFTPLNDGTCPTGAVMGSTIYPNDPDLANVCLSLIRASIVSEAYDDAAYIAAIEAQHSTPFDTSQQTMQTTYTPVVITDNGDGTSTETYSKTETMLDASGNPYTSVTNYSRTTDNATGAEISGSSSESVIADAGENYNPDNYKPENVLDEAPASLDWGDGPDWSTVQNDINISSAENAYTDTAINVTGADPVFNLGSYKGQPLSFSMLPYQSTIQYMGYLIVFMAYVNGFILFAGGKS